MSCYNSYLAWYLPGHISRGKASLSSGAFLSPCSSALLICLGWKLDRVNSVSFSLPSEQQTCQSWVCKEEASSSLLVCGNSSGTRQVTRNLGWPRGKQINEYLHGDVAQVNTVTGSYFTRISSYYLSSNRMLFVKWTLGTLPLPCSPRKPTTLWPRVQSIRFCSKWMQGLNCFQLWGCPWVHFYIFSCVFVPELPTVAWAVHVQYVLFCNRCP